MRLIPNKFIKQSSIQHLCSVGGGTINVHHNSNYIQTSPSPLNKTKPSKISLCVNVPRIKTNTGTKVLVHFKHINKGLSPFPVLLSGSAIIRSRPTETEVEIFPSGKYAIMNTYWPRCIWKLHEIYRRNVNANAKSSSMKTIYFYVTKDGRWSMQVYLWCTKYWWYQADKPAC